MKTIDLHHVFWEEKRRHQRSEETEFCDRHFQAACAFFRDLCVEQGWPYGAVPLEEFEGQGFQQEVCELVWTLRELLQAAILEARKRRQEEKENGEETQAGPLTESCVAKAKEERRAIVMLAIDGQYLPESEKGKRGQTAITTSVTPELAAKVSALIYEIMTSKNNTEIVTL